VASVPNWWWTQIGVIWVAQTNCGKHMKWNSMIKNIIVFLSLAGFLVMLTKVMTAGLGTQWDQVGLIIFMLIAMLLIVTHDD
jgi:hypothetical protein